MIINIIIAIIILAIGGLNLFKSLISAEFNPIEKGSMWVNYTVFVLYIIFAIFYLIAGFV